MGPEVVVEDVGIDDSIIRTWAHIAETSESFSMLRVFNCRSQREISRKVFSHLSRLPNLAVFNAENCKLGPQYGTDALDHGWKYRTGKLLNNSLAKVGMTDASWNAVMHACFNLGGALSTGSLTVEGAEAIDELPRLHLSVGGAPSAAVFDGNRGGNLESFQRSIPVNPFLQINEMPASCTNKRSLSQDLPSVKKPCTKRNLRASKQQDMTRLLNEFNG